MVRRAGIKCPNNPSFSLARRPTRKAIEPLGVLDHNLFFDGSKVTKIVLSAFNKEVNCPR